ncbi:hypothetical protein [Thalassovita sp.]|uniref:hypothetical protein n=1 Tax=Thalassovita sp. TaxID=1979401 RepID=UPI0029DE5BDC|nr:hypothetical protein [Thalassovita sp.]
MFRALTFAAACLLAGPALAETADQKADRCALQAGIVRDAIGHRTGNTGQDRAARRILKSDPVKGTKYESNVDVLVAWVYTLPDAHLTGETVTTFEQACLAFQQ